jgi:hypothetical protein
MRKVLRDSGEIFAGTVLNVERGEWPAIGGLATTQITFRVDEPIRGVQKKQTIQVREWGGLWQAGERYRVGEQVLLFLHPASKLGLTSPVGGSMGRFEIDRNRRVGIKTDAATHIRKVAIKNLAVALRRVVKE